MGRLPCCIFLATISVLCSIPLRGQDHTDAAATLLSQGDEFLKQRDFDKAMAAYRKADKLSHHTCADCFLGMAKIDRQIGNLQGALDDARQAVKAAGDDKGRAAQAHLVRSALLVRMSSKPSDKKLKDAESEAREALALVPNAAIVRFDLGKLLFRQERDTEGIEELKNFIAAPGADPKAVQEARRIIANPIRGREPFAPDFAFVALEGEKFSNASLHGKVVLFDFWGTWCPPCRESVPMLVALRKKYRDKPFEMVGISSDEDEQAWKRFMASNHMDWPDYRDSSADVQHAFEVNSFPTFVVMDRDGVLTFSQSGLNPFLPMELEEAINKALKKPSNPAALAAATAAPPEEPAPGPSIDRDPEKPQTLAPKSTDIGAAAESGMITGNLYINDTLGFSYRFPEGWIAAEWEAIRESSQKAQAAARAQFLEQHPEKANATPVYVPTIILYASPSGQGDGQHLAIPCVRISAMPWLGSGGGLSEVKTRARQWVPPGMSVTRAPEQLTEGGQQFLRTDFASSNGTPQISVSRILTIANDCLLSLEIFARSGQELESLNSPAAFKFLGKAQ